MASGSRSNTDLPKTRPGGIRRESGLSREGLDRVFVKSIQLGHQLEQPQQHETRLSRCTNVTGSCHELEVGGTSLLVDCGLWEGRFVTAGEAVPTVSTGPCAARLQVPREVGHAVMIEPLGGGEFLALDPRIEGTMVVDEGWITRYATAVVQHR